MIYTIATDGKSITIAFDGRLTGKAVRSPRETFNIKKGIGVAIIRTYLDFDPHLPRHTMKGFNYYYIVNIPATCVLELATRACREAGAFADTQKWDTAESYGKAIASRLEILSFTDSYEQMMNDLDHLHHIPENEAHQSLMA